MAGGMAGGTAGGSVELPVTVDRQYLFWKPNLTLAR